MQHNWHYATNGEKHGPITATQLKELAKTGRLASDDLVRREDMKEWRKASSVKGLFPENVKQTTKTPPPMPPTEVEASKAKSVTPKKLLLGCLFIPVLIALLLPAVQQARDAARKAQAERQAGGQLASKKVHDNGNTHADTMLSERYFPYIQGSQRVMNGMVNVGEQILVSKTEFTHSGDGLITKRTLKHSTLQNNKIVRLPIVASDPDIRRVHNGFVDVKNSGWMGAEDGGWEPFIKLGATVGDSWPGAIAEQSFTFTGFRDRVLNGDTVRCAVIEEKMDGPIPMKIVRLYAVDVGLVSERVYNINDGNEVHQRILFLDGLKGDGEE